MWVDLWQSLIPTSVGGERYYTSIHVNIFIFFLWGLDHFIANFWSIGEHVVTMKAESLHAKVMFRYVATCRTICVQMLCLTRSSNLIHAHVGNLILVHIENIAVYLQVMLQLFMFLQLFLKSLFTLLFTLYLLMVMNQKFTSKVCVKWLIDILKIFSVVVFMYLFLLKHTCIEVLEKIIHGNTLH